METGNLLMYACSEDYEYDDRVYYGQHGERAVRSYTLVGRNPSDRYPGWEQSCTTRSVSGTNINTQILDSP